MKVWEVRVSLPLEEGSKWRKNAMYFVVTDTAARAMELTSIKHPGAEVWQVIHRGDDVLVDFMKYVTVDA